MRASLQHRPLLWFSCAFALGVTACGAGLTPIWLLALLLTAGLSLLVAQSRLWMIAPVGLILAGVACGALRETGARINPANDVSHFASAQALTTVSGVIADDPEIRPGRLVFRLRAERVQARGVTVPVSGQVYVSLASPHARRLPALDYGDHVALRGYLEPPRAATNPGAFSWRDYLARQGVYAALNVRQAPVMLPQTGESSPFLSLAWRTRRRIVSTLKERLPAEDAAVLCGILVGQRSDLPLNLMADFVHTGTIHILASAGLHVGVLVWWLLAAARRLTIPARWAAVGIVATLWLYAVMAGGRPSVTRAVLLATVYLAARIFEREPDLPTSLAFASLAILLDNPETLFDSGFQMSFLTVATLAAAMPLWTNFWREQTDQRIANSAARRAAHWALELVGLTLFAQIGSTPIVAAAYNEFSLTGVAANLLVVPALFILIPLGFLTAVLACISSAAAQFGAMLLLPLLDYVIAVVHAFGEAPGAFRAVPTPSAVLIALYYTVIAAVIWVINRRNSCVRKNISSPASTFDT